MFHRSHEPKQQLSWGFDTSPESLEVHLDPSIRTAGEIVSRDAARATGGYPDLAAVPDAPESRLSSIPRHDSGDETIRTEIAS
jgi:hypothetical protein